MTSFSFSDNVFHSTDLVCLIEALAWRFRGRRRRDEEDYRRNPEVKCSLLDEEISRRNYIPGVEEKTEEEKHRGERINFKN